MRLCLCYLFLSLLKNHRYKKFVLIERLMFLELYFQKKINRIEHKDTSELVNYQFSSVAQLCPTLCDPMECSMPGFSVHQTKVN